jgi:hypothetical protein
MSRAPEETDTSGDDTGGEHRHRGEVALKFEGHTVVVALDAKEPASTKQAAASVESVESVESFDAYLEDPPPGDAPPPICRQHAFGGQACANDARARALMHRPVEVGHAAGGAAREAVRVAMTNRTLGRNTLQGRASNPFSPAMIDAFVAECRARLKLRAVSDDRHIDASGATVVVLRT